MFNALNVMKHNECHCFKKSYTNSMKFERFIESILFKNTQNNFDNRSPTFHFGNN